MEQNDGITYTLTIWMMGRPEKMWQEMTAGTLARFEETYAAFVRSNDTKAVYVLECDDKRRTIRLDLITDYSVIENS